MTPLLAWQGSKFKSVPVGKAYSKATAAFISRKIFTDLRMVPAPPKAGALATNF